MRSTAEYRHSPWRVNRTSTASQLRPPSRTKLSPQQQTVVEVDIKKADKKIVKNCSVYRVKCINADKTRNDSQVDDL